MSRAPLLPPGQRGFADDGNLGKVVPLQAELMLSSPIRLSSVFPSHLSESSCRLWDKAKLFNVLQGLVRSCHCLPFPGLLFCLHLPQALCTCHSPSQPFVSSLAWKLYSFFRSEPKSRLRTPGSSPTLRARQTPQNIYFVRPLGISDPTHHPGTTRRHALPTSWRKTREPGDSIPGVRCPRNGIPVQE